MEITNSGYVLSRKSINTTVIKIWVTCTMFSWKRVYIHQKLAAWLSNKQIQISSWFLYVLAQDLEICSARNLFLITLIRGPRNNETTEQRNNGTTKQWNYGTMKQWNKQIVSQQQSLNQWCTVSQLIKVMLPLLHTLIHCNRLNIINETNNMLTQYGLELSCSYW